MSSLHEVKDPFTGKEAVSQLFTKEQLYGKDCAGNPPDIIYFLNDLKYNQISSVNSSSLWQNNPSTLTGKNFIFSCLIIFSIAFSK